MILKLTKIPKLNTLVIKQVGGKIFITSHDSIVIDEEGLLDVLKGLAYNELINTSKFVEELDFVITDLYRQRRNDESIQENTFHSD